MWWERRSVEELRICKGPSLPPLCQMVIIWSDPPVEVLGLRLGVLSCACTLLLPCAGEGRGVGMLTHRVQTKHPCGDGPLLGSHPSPPGTVAS